MSHPVYPDGPVCNPDCPGVETSYHEGYADGYEASQRALTAAVIRALPITWPSVPADVWGSTRKRWTRRGIKVAFDSLGLSRE